MKLTKDDLEMIRSILRSAQKNSIFYGLPVEDKRLEELIQLFDTDQILQNQEDAEKRRELVCPRCDGFIDTVVNSVHLVICENGHEFDDSNKIIVERLKKWKSDEDEAIVLFEGTSLQTQELSVHQWRKLLSAHIQKILGEEK